ncbi:MAG: tetratricopeptide repeat protein [Acidobacteria bacterium]|nr:tetratricopeptide repeat protein [Acidobacteriota bacterium]
MCEDKPDRVDEEYRRIVALKPGRIEPYMMIADYYQVRRDASKLQMAVDAAGRVSPSDPRLLYFRGVLRVLQGGDLRDGERQLKSYLTSAPQRSDYPSHASAREWLARLYEREGKRALAIEQYRTILRTDPKRMGVREALRRLEEQP